MDYRIDGRAIKQADQVLVLWRAYGDAGYSLQEMGISAIRGFEPADLAAFAHTDLMPLRIKGKLYPVNEYVSSLIVAAAQQMLQWAEDAHVDARELCIQNLEYISGLLRERRAVTIACISREQWVMRITAGTQSQLADAVAVMTSLAALGLNTFGIEQLLDETVRLVPV